MINEPSVSPGRASGAPIFGRLFAPFVSLGQLWRRDRWMFVVYIAIAAFLALFILYPLLKAALAPGWSEWSRVFTTPRWRSAVGNTMVMAVLSTLSSTVIGFVYAYAVTRAKIPGSGFFKIVPLLPLITPPFVSGLAFILLFGRRGIVTYELLGLHTDIYGWHGLWLAQTVSFFPVAFLAISGVLQSINPTLEQAARSLGSRGWHTFRTVVLPLAVPGIAASALLVAISVLGDFGNPMLIAGRYRVLATEAYLQISGWADMRMGAALGMLMFVPALGFFFLQKKIQGGKGASYATVGGRGSRMEAAELAPWVRWSLFVFCLAITLFLTAKYVVILIGAFTKVWGVDYTFTLQNFEYTLFRSVELWNSLRFASVAALICAALATVTSYLVYRQRIPFGTQIDLVTLLPAAIPGTLLGISYVLAFNTPPLALAGTGTIIVLSMVFSYLPVGYRLNVATLQQIERSMEESASDLGASGMRTFADIILPLIKVSFTSALVYCFVKAIGTLSAVIFLISHGKVVASASILNLAEQGYWGWAAAMATALMLIACLALALFRLIAGRRFKIFDI